MAPAPRIRSVIVCDDVRTEVTGKEILVGVYPGRLVAFGTSPARLLQLCFRFDVSPDPEERERPFEFHLLSPSNTKIVDVSGRIRLKKDERAIIGFSQFNVVLYESGTYKIRAGFDGNIKTADTLEVSFQAVQGQSSPSAAPQSRAGSEPLATAQRQ